MGIFVSLYCTMKTLTLLIILTLTACTTTKVKIKKDDHSKVYVYQTGTNIPAFDVRNKIDNDLADVYGQFSPFHKSDIRANIR